MHIVSITSDFGYHDYFVAELKAQIHYNASNIKIIDVSHSLDPHDIVQAAYFVNNVFRSFPNGSIHLIAVYNHYDRDRRYIAVERQGHFFLAPDNGVLSLLFNDLTAAEVRIIKSPEHEKTQTSICLAFGVKIISTNNSIDNLGPVPANISLKMGINPVVTNSYIRATIIHIDHYQNVVINVKKKEFEKIRGNRSFELYYKQHDPITRISSGYGDAPIGDVIALFNPADYMEIAINMGKASSILNLYKNETIQINFL
ncbi:MAG: SAM-dependent chlorinase/fluorinase [Saprospiraceae bacterium]